TRCQISARSSLTASGTVPHSSPRRSGSSRVSAAASRRATVGPRGGDYNAGARAVSGAGGAVLAFRGKNKSRRPVYWRDLTAAQAVAPRRRTSIDEADLSAEEAQARTDAWLPSPDANPGRAPGPEAPPAQGPQAPHPVAMAGKPRRRGRLSRSGDFDRAYRDGRSHSNRYLVVYAFPRPDGDGDGEGVRLGVSVGRKLGKAVTRNKIKRPVMGA